MQSYIILNKMVENKKNILSGLDLGNILRVDDWTAIKEKIEGSDLFASFCLWLINRHEDIQELSLSPLIYVRDYIKYSHKNNSIGYWYFSIMEDCGYLSKTEMNKRHMTYTITIDLKTGKPKIYKLLPLIKKRLGLDKKGGKK